jgi:hypothetical protein
VGEIQETHYYQRQDGEQKQDFLRLEGHEEFCLIGVDDMECE